MSGNMGRSGATRASLKGNLALKSSPLNPSSGKMVQQDLIVDHMNAHYKKLLNAKSAIDASVPRAYVSSQKVRDRQTRDYIMKSGKSSGNRPTSARSGSGRPGSARHSRPGSARGARRSYDPQIMQGFKMDDVDYGDFTADEINCINAMVNDTIDSERLDRVLNGAPATQRTLGGRGVGKDTARTSRSGGSGSGGLRTSRGLTEGMTMNTLQRKNTSADILDKRNHAFSEPQGMFTPRVLKNPKYKDVPSKLSQTKHFRPAKRTSPPPVSRNKSGYAQSTTDSEMLDETLMSRDFTSRMTMSGNVPKLDISIDQDHMKWLQDQSARHENKDYRPLEQELNQGQPQGQVRGQHQSRPRGQQMSQAIDNKKVYTRKKIQKEDEELEYLDFIGDVTNDVLTRGIFTNRVLCNVFEEHVQKNKNKLDENRMRGMLDNLREDLGIPERESYRDNPEDVGMGSSRPSVRSKTKTTGYTGDPAQFKNVRVGQLSRETGYSDQAKASGDYHKVNGFGGTQTMAATDPQSLTDIAEVSEKTVSSIRSKASSKQPHTPQGSHRGANKQHKQMDDALVDLLGLEDIEETGPATNGITTGIEKMSVKSDLSSHTSDKVSAPSSRKASVPYDPLDAFAATLAERDQADQASVKSSASKKSAKSSGSKTSTLKGSATSSKPRPLDRQASRESVGSAPRPAPRRASIDSRPSVTPRRQQSVDSYADDTESNADLTKTIESNADFGKTTVFGKTRELGLTYKALSQASDEEDYDYNDDKFSDDGKGKYSDDDF